MALNNVSNHKRAENATTNGNHTTNNDEADDESLENGHYDPGSPEVENDPERRDSNADSSIIETPIASRRPSNNLSLAPELAGPVDFSTEGKNLEKEIPPPPQNGTEHGYISGQAEAPGPWSALSLMRSGVILHIRPKYRNASHSGTSGDELHDRYMTDSTSGEILLSPSASRSSLGSDKTAGIKHRTKTVNPEEKEENRMSTLS